MPERCVWSLGAGGWVVRADGAVLLVRMTYGPAIGRLMIPGGQVEPGEMLDAAAVREVREETGVETVCRRLLLVRQRTRLDSLNVYVVFELVPVGGTERPLAAEVSELAWLRPEAIVARDDVQPIAAELARAWLGSPGAGLDQRPLSWQDPATYRLWTGPCGQPTSGT